MSTVEGVRVEGLTALVKHLQTMGVEVDDLKTVFGGIAKDAADLAASFAPHRSGRLASSVRGNKSKNKAVVAAGGARVRYAAPINYGWPKRGIRASHFMQRASDAIAPTVQPRLESAIERLIAERGLQ